MGTVARQLSGIHPVRPASPSGWGRSSGSAARADGGGCGKSALGVASAARLSLPFLEGDDFHPPANLAAMASGIGLTDAMRRPWLQALAQAMPDSCVASCSSLRRSYRDILGKTGCVFFIHLVLDVALARRRMAFRTDHFMPASRAEIQVRLLEPLAADESGLALNAGLATSDMVNSVLQFLTPVRTAPKPGPFLG
jgi:gluconokinase